MGNSCCVHTEIPGSSGRDGEAVREYPRRPLIMNINETKPANLAFENEPDAPKHVQILGNEPTLEPLIQKLYAHLGVFEGDKALRNTYKQLPVLGPYRYEDGSTYLGQYKNGLRHGEGRLYCNDGSVIEGYWIDEIACGPCRILYPDGRYTTGRCVSGLLEGIGIEETPFGDGGSYKGSYRKGMKHGYGVQTMQDGSRYEGDFFNNNIHGKGRRMWFDGRKYEGDWIEGKMHGEGVFTWDDGKMYAGGYVDDKKQGYGEFYFPNGSFFKGQWLDGRQNGEGSLTNVNGETTIGLWENGKPALGISSQPIKEDHSVVEDPSISINYQPES